MSRLACAVALLALVAAGCTMPPPADGPHAVAVQVLAAGAPVADAAVRLVDAAGSATARTDEAGAARFPAAQPGACWLDVDAAGFVPKRLALTCGGARQVTVALTPVGSLPPATAASTPSATPEAPAPVRHTVRGALVDEAGARVAGSWRALDGEGGSLDGGVAADGAFMAALPAGTLAVRAEAPCRAPLERSLDLQQDLEVEMILPPADTSALPAPAVRAHPGPAGLVTLAWGPVEGAHRYEVLEGDAAYDVGGARAWGDHTPSASYQVRAVSPCGVPGAAAEVAAAARLPDIGVPPLTPPALATVQSTMREYPVFGADGTQLGTQEWRVVEGTGNCCENYLVTTRQGWILDFGGSTLLVSKDEGASWERITPRGAQLCGEGAVVPGPGGDIYAMNWELCLRHGTDGVWSLKYVAADDQWVEGLAPVHSPFFDRPWMSVFPGPHAGPDGELWPVRSYIFSNFNDGLYGAGHVVAGDGVLYQPDAPQADQASGADALVPAKLSPDPDADWTQPQVSSFGKQLDPGLGVLDTGLSLCTMLDTPDGRACSPREFPVRSMQRDSAGRLHAARFEAETIVYRWSDDVGATWQETRIAYPPGVTRVLEWDLKAHRALDRAVVAIHAEVAGGATSYAILLRDVGGTPRLDRILQVGAEPGTAGSGVAADVRYDFMTAGFLPDGRVVLSFTDGEFHPPSVAVQMA